MYDSSFFVFFVCLFVLNRIWNKKKIYHFTLTLGPTLKVIPPPWYKGMGVVGGGGALMEPLP